MVYNILGKLESEDKLKEAVITIPDDNLPKKRRTILGGEVTKITRSCLEYQGGESGYEAFTIPLSSIIQVSFQGRTLFLRKKRIERIYPRR